MAKPKKYEPEEVPLLPQVAAIYVSADEMYSHCLALFERANRGDPEALSVLGTVKVIAQKRPQKFL